MLSNLNLKIFLLYTIFPLFITGQMALGDMSSHASWQRIESSHAIIQYKTLKDLKKFNDNIEYSPGKWGLSNFFSFSGSKDPTDSIKMKVDSVFEKVTEILDMSIWMDRVVINIYPNKKSFDEVRDKLFGEDCRLRAWYLFERNTIYINARDVHEGILAHEIAHAVVDHYLTVRPPKATAEILARYVDKHLFN